MNKFIENKTNKADILLIGLHIFIGGIATLFPFIVTITIVLTGLLYLVKYSRNDTRKLQTLIFISYLTGIEILYRAAGVSFLPYELSKYVQIGFILINLFIARTWFNSFVGILLVILMLPSLILFPANLFKYFIFNSLGIFSLAVFIAYTGKEKIIFPDFVKVLKSFLLPCISFVTFITIKTPEFADIDFSLGANFETTGDFGANQVATLLGAAICFLIIMTEKKTYLGHRLITFGFMAYFFLRALLSFSRGGIIGLLLSFMLSFLLFKKIKQAAVIKFGIAVVLFSVVFVITNSLTGGALLLRYQGETEGTIAGNKEKNFENLSSGRSSYAEVDVAMWFDNIALGVGPGNSQFTRFKYGLYDESAPHTEATRLLAENGIFGLFINLLLVFWPMYIVYKTYDRDIRFIKSILFIFAYATTFHSAIRSGLTPLFYGLASMDILPSYYLPADKKINIPLSEVDH